MATVNIKPVAIEQATITIESLTPMIQHRWSDSARETMKAKKMGKKTKDREPCDPEQEFNDATYRTEAGEYGVPMMAVKNAIIGAAHKDLGVEKTLVRKSLFLECRDPGKIIPIRCDTPFMREDTVRVGMKSADLRYRPEFPSWECDLHIKYDSANLTIEDIVNLVNRAGFGVGIGDWRPEKGGEFGRFGVKASPTT